MGKFERLKWDSDFFGLNVAKLESENLSYINNVLEKCNNDLVYLISNNQDIFYKYSHCLVDCKTTYVANISNKCSVDIPNIEIEEYFGSVDDNLKQLAVQAGQYSRFMIDKNIVSGQKLYEQWIENSINRTIAKSVIVAKLNNKIIGLVTLGIKNGRGDIGLVAVDSSMRGKSVGTALIQSAKNWFYDNNILNIQVVTQDKNIPAKKLYEKCDFIKESEINYYHIWLNK